ncbi:MAG: hypothetical protein ABI877_03800 [Gemmatimonadaceae bacterium]
MGESVRDSPFLLGPAIDIARDEPTTMMLIPTTLTETRGKEDRPVVGHEGEGRITTGSKPRPNAEWTPFLNRSAQGAGQPGFRP